MQMPPMIHHKLLNPRLCATCVPLLLPITCAALHAIVYNAAYCPRLPSVLLEIYHEFMKGMAVISAIVTTIVAKTATRKPLASGIFNMKKDIAINIEPYVISLRY